MGYMKNQMLEEHELEFFLESAKAGTLEEYYPNEVGKRSTREMLIDTRGNTEETSGTLYKYHGVQVFVPDHIFMLTQPIIEPLGTEYNAVTCFNNN